MYDYDWISSHKHPPKEGQKVYYFGYDIGIWTGTYSYRPQVVVGVSLCPHLFFNETGGVVDACDAPWWKPYDPDREPMPPPEYI